MAFELDHLFICTAVNAPAAAQLTQFGLVEGRSNVHAGQGTANRCFFFHNLMLELLWVHNAAEAQSENTRPTYLWERWSGRAQGTCPFGVCLRPVEGQAPEILPFPTWNYQPTYFPAGVAIPIKIQTGPAHLMELGFDGETQGQHHDFRPALPLIVHW